LLGYGGLLDALVHALAALDGALDRAAAQPDHALEQARVALRRADAAAGLMREALWAGATEEQHAGAEQPHAAANRALWKSHRRQDFSGPERATLEFMAARGPS
jgi:hypothetical protein